MRRTKYETCTNMTVIGIVQTVNERPVNFKGYNSMKCTKHEKIAQVSYLGFILFTFHACLKANKNIRVLQNYLKIIR